MARGRNITETLEIARDVARRLLEAQLGIRIVPDLTTAGGLSIEAEAELPQTPHHVAVTEAGTCPPSVTGDERIVERIGRDRRGNVASRSASSGCALAAT